MDNAIKSVLKDTEENTGKKIILVPTDALLKDKYEESSPNIVFNNVILEALCHLCKYHGAEHIMIVNFEEPYEEKDIYDSPSICLVMNYALRRYFRKKGFEVSISSVFSDEKYILGTCAYMTLNTKFNGAFSEEDINRVIDNWALATYTLSDKDNILDHHMKFAQSLRVGEKEMPIIRVFYIDTGEIFIKTNNNTI